MSTNPETESKAGPEFKAGNEPIAKPMMLKTDGATADEAKPGNEAPTGFTAPERRTKPTGGAKPESEINYAKTATSGSALSSGSSSGTSSVGTNSKTKSRNKLSRLVERILRLKNKDSKTSAMKTLSLIMKPADFVVDNMILKPYNALKPSASDANVLKTSGRSGTATSESPIPFDASSSDNSRYHGSIFLKTIPAKERRDNFYGVIDENLM